MFAQNKEYLNPKGYPNLIKQELQESKDIAIIYLKNPGIFYKHYFKLICLYSSIVYLVLLLLFYIPVSNTKIKNNIQPFNIFTTLANFAIKNKQKTKAKAA